MTVGRALASTGSPYADAALLYRAAGWTSPLPIGLKGQRSAKFPVPRGFTGRAAVVPTEDDIAGWIDEGYGGNNIGLHFAPELCVIGIDVDHYGDKRGADTLAGLQAELGPLPPTVRSSARGFDNPSGIRFYRVPAGEGGGPLEFIAKLSGIDVIQAKHRYAIVWPSVHPETGSTYEWWTPSGEALGRAPRFSALPSL